MSFYTVDRHRTMTLNEVEISTIISGLQDQIRLSKQGLEEMADMFHMSFEATINDSEVLIDKLQHILNQE